MAYKFTLSDARNEPVLKKVAAQCASSQDFVDQVNEAQRKLLRKGSWFSTETLVRICYYDNCVTWPRYVGTVEGIRYGNGTPVQVRNQWYTILAGIGQYGQQGQWGGSWGGAGFGSTDGAWTGGYGYGAITNSTLQYTDYAPYYRKLYGCTGTFLRVFALKREDWGKKVTFFGTDWMGQPLQEMVDGVWQPGTSVILGNDLGNGFVQTKTRIREWTSTTKDLTQGNVMVYSVQPDDTATTVYVSGAGTAGANGVYTYNSGTGNYEKGTPFPYYYISPPVDGDPYWYIVYEETMGNALVLYRNPLTNVSGQYEIGTLDGAPDAPYAIQGGKLIDHATYEPSETNPRWRQSLLTGFGMKCRTGDSGQCHGCVEALVKLAFIPLVAENDFLLIDNFDALAYEIQAIRYFELGDSQRGKEFEGMAINELNAELRTELPDNTTTVSIQCTPSAIRSPF